MTLRSRLLDWYDKSARDLPWRVAPGRNVAPDPYRVWLSEVMLQQTTVAHATPYFERFTARWPGVADLAAEADGEVMAAWAGLGYYARARNLLACARAVVTLHGGRFPGTEAGLRTLPGLGPYTAAAVAAIGFDQPSNVVDGNVERVMARVHAVEAPMPGARETLRGLAAQYVTDHRPGDWAQALMDLGATVCKPRSPACGICPLARECRARTSGAPETFPRKSAKPARPHRYGVVFVLTDGPLVGLVRRPARGLLGGMLALPTSDWRAESFEPDEVTLAAPAPAHWREVGEIEHVFTHFSLTLRVLVAQGRGGDLIWSERAALAGLPSVFAKAARLALG